MVWPAFYGVRIAAVVGPVPVPSLAWTGLGCATLQALGVQQRIGKAAARYQNRKEEEERERERELRCLPRQRET